MAEIQSMVENVFSESETILNRALDNVYISTGIKVFIGLYAAFAAPQLPKSLVDLMDNVLMRIGVAFLIVFLATRDPSIALLVAIAFVVTLQQANKLRLYETSLSVASPGETSWLPSVSDETPDVNEVQMPGEVVNNVSDNNDLSTPTTNESNMLGQPVTQNDQQIARSSIPSDTVHDVIENMVPSQVDGLATNAAPLGNFTSSNQLDDAQSNNIPGSNQESCVGSYDEQYCAQGFQGNTPESYSGHQNASF
jgi:hypothetical protein